MPIFWVGVVHELMVCLVDYFRQRLSETSSERTESVCLATLGTNINNAM